jgi:DNA-binding MarR family transcriptional regulator
MEVATIGFLKADGHRLRILETLGKRPGATAKQLAGRLRIHQRLSDATIKELLEKGLIKKNKKNLSLTSEGVRALTQVSRVKM